MQQMDSKAAISGFISVNSTSNNNLPPLMTRAKWADLIGLPVTVVTAAAERGLWGAPIYIGKRVFINVEAIRIAAAKKAEHFTL